MKSFFSMINNIAVELEVDKIFVVTHSLKKKHSIGNMNIVFLPLHEVLLGSDGIE